jgi:hypothetical protein
MRIPILSFLLARICCFSFINDRNLSPGLLDLGRPTLDALALAADWNVDLGLALHSPRALEERVARHAAGVGALGGHELEHGQEEVADTAGLFHAKVVFLAQHVGQGPVAQAVDVAELAFAVEDLLRPLAADAERFGKRAEQLDDLCNVVVVLAVLGAGLRVEEIVSCDKLESLDWVSNRVLRECVLKECPHHSSHTPYVCAGAPFCAQDYFRRAVLSRLNVVCEMVPNPTCVTQIGNLDRNNVDTIRLVLFEFFRWLHVCSLPQVHP